MTIAEWAAVYVAGWVVSATAIHVAIALDSDY